MIKIIKEGSLKLIKKFHCQYCGCIFEADDDSYLIDTCYPYSTETFLKINCPCCGTLVLRKFEDYKNDDK
jgi:hypothetical protein